MGKNRREITKAKNHHDQDNPATFDHLISGSTGSIHRDETITMNTPIANPITDQTIFQTIDVLISNVQTSIRLDMLKFLLNEHTKDPTKNPRLLIPDLNSATKISNLLPSEAQQEFWHDIVMEIINLAPIDLDQLILILNNTCYRNWEYINNVFPQIFQRQITNIKQLQKIIFEINPESKSLSFSCNYVQILFAIIGVENITNLILPGSDRAGSANGQNYHATLVNLLENQNNIKKIEFTLLALNAVLRFTTPKRNLWSDIIISRQNLINLINSVSNSNIDKTTLVKLLGIEALELCIYTDTELFDIILNIIVPENRDLNDFLNLVGKEKFNLLINEKPENLNILLARLSGNNQGIVLDFLGVNLESKQLIINAVIAYIKSTELTLPYVPSTDIIDLTYANLFQEHRDLILKPAIIAPKDYNILDEDEFVFLDDDIIDYNTYELVSYVPRVEEITLDSDASLSTRCVAGVRNIISRAWQHSPVSSLPLASIASAAVPAANFAMQASGTLITYLVNNPWLAQRALIAYTTVNSPIAGAIAGAIMNLSGQMLSTTATTANTPNTAITTCPNRKTIRPPR